MAWRANPAHPILPTVNPKPGTGGELLIDWLLVNEAMATHVIPDSYAVHIPEHGQPYPSDHRLITAAVNL